LPRRMLPQLDDLVQTSAHIAERIIRQSLERVRPCTPHTPVERFWLVTENVTGLSSLAFPFGFSDGNRKWVVRIVFGCCHGKPDDKGGDIVEVLRGKDQKRVHIAHFLSCLWIAIDPNDVLTSRNPRPTAFRFAACGYHSSAPTA
jgi:hypothetical protein